MPASRPSGLSSPPSTADIKFHSNITPTPHYTAIACYPFVFQKLETNGIPTPNLPQKDLKQKTYPRICRFSHLISESEGETEGDNATYLRSYLVKNPSTVFKQSRRVPVALISAEPRGISVIYLTQTAREKAELFLITGMAIQQISLLALGDFLDPAFAHAQFSLLVGLPLHVFVELFHLSSVAVCPIVMQAFDQLNHVPLHQQRSAVEFSHQLVLVAGNCFLHEAHPVGIGDEFQVELAAGGLVERFRQDMAVLLGLQADESAVALHLFPDLAVLPAGQKLSEVLLLLEEVVALGELASEGGEVVVGAFAEDEEGDGVVGVYLLVDAQDARHHLLEDEHETVAPRYVLVLPLLYAQLHTSLLLPLRTQRLQHCLLHRLLLALRPLLLCSLLFFFTWQRQRVTIIEHLILLQTDGRCHSVYDLVFLDDERMAVDILPADASLRIDGEAAVDEIPGFL